MGLLESVNGMAMGLVGVPWATALWDLFQTGLPNYTATNVAGA